MEVKDLLKLDSIHLLTKNGNMNQNISDMYTCDLLSWVMGKVRKEDVVLLTVLKSMNAVAIASLLNLSAIIFCEGVTPDQTIIDKANDENINIFVSNKTSCETAIDMYKYESIL